MRKIAAIFAASVVVLASLSAQAGVQDFKIKNSTPYTIKELYISPANVDDWEENVLKGIIRKGATMPITFTGVKDSICEWDIKVVDEDGDDWVIEDVDLCEVEKVVFYNQGTKILYKAE